MMDSFDMSQKELDINLLELEFINKWLGGYAVSLGAFSRLDLKPGSEISIVDVGCGGGDGMIAIQQHLAAQGVKARMIGVDANPKAIAYARKRCSNHPDFEWVTSHFQELHNLKADVWHCSLFAHHFYDNDLEQLAFLMTKNSSIGFIINDLHRHWLAYYSISVLTGLFSGSRLVRNDARLSVAKGFSRKEMEALFDQSQFRELFVRWRWAFRWQMVGMK